MFTVSINPTYLCNFRCPFCYLTEKQLKDPKKLDLQKLRIALMGINAYQKINHVDLYGGEVCLLSNEYMKELLDIVREYTSAEKINVVTNGSRPLEKCEWLLDDDIDVSVSWDYICRREWEEVLHNIAYLPKPVHILMLASKCMMEWDDEDIDVAQMFIESVKNIVSVEIKPYSVNQANQEDVPYTEYEEFVKRWMKVRDENDISTYEFINEKLMLESISKTRNAFSDDHIYITPDGKLAVLEFDEQDKEYFLELETYCDYIKWTKHEKQRVRENKICSSCPFYGSCLSEHLREVKSIDESCNGFRFLLEWYDERIQVKTGDVSQPDDG